MWLDADAAAVSFDDAPADGQSQSGALVTAAVGGPVEGLEDLGPVGFRNADAVVGDLNADGVAGCHPGGDVDLRDGAGPLVFERVADQVVDHVSQEVRIGVYVG
ncbi:hypothetical protein DMB66_51880 [Actinoplanes sp. ATCC 53533]|nr:hypothetical protein DMB66_51880 [Actinoplanes sp. ATCC 53533]